MRRTIIVAGLLATLAGIAGAQQIQTEQSPAASSITQDAPAPGVLRRAKCAYLWQRVNPKSFDPKLVAFFCREYEQAGIGPEWWFAFANWVYASGLNPRMSCRDGKLWARGLADCTQRNGPVKAFADLGSTDLFNPFVSVRNDRLETERYHKQTGLEGWALRRKVFLPGTPRRWSWAQAEARRMQEQRRWQRVEKRHLCLLSAGYAAGKLEVAK